MKRIRRGLSEAEHKRVGELFLEKIAYHEAGHAVCLIYCGIHVSGMYLHPTPMPVGSEVSLGCCISGLQKYKIWQLLFSCAGARYGEDLAPGISELRRIAAEHPVLPVRGDVKQMLRAATVEYNALLLEFAKSQAGPYGVGESRMRTIIKEDFEPAHRVFCGSKEFNGAVEILAKCLLRKRIITSQRVLNKNFLRIPTIQNERFSPLFVQMSVYYD